MKTSRFTPSRALRNLALGVLLIALGLGLALTAPARELKQAQAQGGSDYSATWTATDLIVGRLLSPDTSTEAKCESANPPFNGYGSPANSEVAIGPAKWMVKGAVDSSLKFKEIWSTPVIPTSVNWGDGTWRTFWGFGGFCTDLKLKIVGNQNQGDWMLGFAQDMDLAMSAVAFRTVTVTEALTSIHNVDAGRVGNIGKTTSCQLGNRCMYVTGSYSWTTFHELDEAQNGKYVNLGTLMPVRWNVTGSLCNPGDNRCD